MSFSFIFSIKLHIDDLKVLQLINKKFKIGKIYVYTSDSSAILKINKIVDLQKLFYILDIKPLNTTKYLDYFIF